MNQKIYILIWVLRSQWCHHLYWSKVNCVECSWLHSNNFFNNFSVMVVPVVVDSSKRFNDFISDTKRPLIHGLRGGLNLYLIYFIITKFWILIWSKILNFSLSSVAAPTKFASLYDFIIFMLPLLELKRQSERIN